MDVIKITNEIELQDAFDIRKKVFVEEQKVPFEDEFDQFDTLEGDTEHVLAYYGGHPAGTGRMRIVEGIGKLERICILEPFRKHGLGRIIIAKLEELAAAKALNIVKLHGQTQAEGFYSKLGYQTASPEFMEDGISHVLMTKNLKP
ncbi:GNAT family N-acetyltransferase [Bacillus testis]|uniref:GNAT family N-acetyltransferase n=1 Tax=Bacillus testis TaxID=1622072 RepID=UPI00067EA1BD|nr:GNAT family N-acetyltransferase [Bacillus testis]